jgi:hypothetical protein
MTACPITKSLSRAITLETLHQSTLATILKGTLKTLLDTSRECVKMKSIKGNNPDDKPEANP